MDRQKRGVSGALLTIALLLCSFALSSCSEPSPTQPVQLSSETCLMTPTDEQRQEFAAYETQNRQAVSGLAKQGAAYCVLRPDLGVDDYAEWDVEWVDAAQHDRDYALFAATWEGGLQLVGMSPVAPPFTTPQYLALQLLAVVDADDYAHWVYPNGAWGAHTIALPIGQPKHKKAKPSIHKPARSLPMHTVPSRTSVAKPTSSTSRPAPPPMVKTSQPRVNPPAPKVHTQAPKPNSVPRKTK